MQRFKKIIVLLTCCMISICATACNDKAVADYDSLDSIAVKDNQDVVIDRFNEILCVYDKDSKEICGRCDPEKCNVYSFPTGTELYTVGSSDSYGFKLIENKRDKIEVLYNAPERHGLFPLCEDDGTYYLEEIGYDDDGSPASFVLLTMDADSREITRIMEMSADIQYAAICGNIFYYTTYDEAKDKYYLWSNDSENLNSKKSEKLAELECGEIYSLGSRLYVTDGKHMKPFEGEGRSYTYCKDAYIIDNKAMVQYELNNDSLLNLKIIDLKSGELVDSAENPIAFFCGKSQMEVYYEGDILTYDFH